MKKRLIAPICLFMALVSCKKYATDEIATDNVSTTPSEVAVMALPSSPTVPAAPYGYTWGQAWQDNFDNLNFWDGVNEDVKKVSLGTNLVNFQKRADMVSVSNGILYLYSKKVNSNTMYSGCVSSANHKAIKYGFLVARMYIQDPTKLGSQSSFWSNYYEPTTDKTGADDGCEMDVFESSWTDDKVQSNLHWDWFTKNPYLPQHGRMAAWTATGSRTGYHDYGLLWTPGRLEIYYDGVKQGNSFLDATKIPDVWQYMLLGTAYAWDNAKGAFNNATNGTIGVTKVDLVRYVPFK